jgi:uncharacterized protein YjbJ (UPF0337 family)
MEKVRIGENWIFIRGKLKKLYRSLTDDDLSYEEGKELELIAQLQQALRRKRGDIVNIINYIADSYNTSDSPEEFDLLAKEEQTTWKG